VTTTTHETTARRRVTPAARLVLSAEHMERDRAAWLNARRSGIGSSDIAAVLGLSRYGNALSVYHDKRGGLPLESDDSEPALWGRLDEETLAREWARRNRSVIRKVGLIASVERPWQMCSLDRRVLECPLNRETREACALEVKHRDKMKSSQWRAGCPDDVLAQVLWQMDATGFDHLHVAVRIGGNDYRQFTVRAADHQQTIADLRAAGASLWQRIAAGRPPVLDFDADEPPHADPLIDLYRRLHPGRDGVIHIDRDFDAQDALGDYLDECAKESAAKKAKKLAYARMLGSLGGAQTAAMGDNVAFSIEPTATERADLERLRERWPEAYADCVQTAVGTRLNIPKRVREEHTA